MLRTGISSPRRHHRHWHQACPNFYADEAKPHSCLHDGYSISAQWRIQGSELSARWARNSLVENLLAAEVQVHALCDVVREKAEHAQSLVVEGGAGKPELYTNGDHAFESLVGRDDLDLVIIATPWNWHMEMAVAAMKHGKHAAVEVPAATTIEDCWKLVDSRSRHGKHCMMLENCCYGYNETLILRMIHGGLVRRSAVWRGRLHYDLRKSFFQKKAKGCGGGIHTPATDGNLYPTHGFGPVANYMSIQRGDRSITSCR